MSLYIYIHPNIKDRTGNIESVRKITPNEAHTKQENSAKPLYNNPGEQRRGMWKSRTATGDIENRCRANISQVNI